MPIDAGVTIRAKDKTKAAFGSVHHSLNKLGKSFSNLGVTIGVAVGAETARRLVVASDNMNALRIRTETATKVTGDYALVWRTLNEAVQETGGNIADAVSTFQNLSRVRYELDATNNDMLTLTRTVQQLGVIGGSTTENLKYGLRQFNQAMSQPFFRAEEFNSILENIPEVAARIAKGMNKTQGELRNLVLEGKLASRDVFQVLLGQSTEIANEFEKIPLTVGRASAKLTNSFIQWINRLDEAAGITETIANNMNQVAGLFNKPTEDAMITRFSELKLEIEQAEQSLANLMATADNKGKPGMVARLRRELESLYDEATGIRKELLALKSQRDNASSAAIKEEFRNLEVLKDPFSGEDALSLIKAGLAARGQAYQADLEMLTQTQVAKLPIMLQAAQTEREQAQELADVLVEIERNKQQRIADAVEEGALSLQSIKAAHDNWEVMAQTQKAQFVLNSIANLSAGMAVHSRKAFEINKASAIASATVKGYEAVQQALAAFPPPFSYVAAAATAAKAAIQIAGIKKTQYRGGGGSLSVSGGGSAIPSQNQLPDPSLPSNDQKGQSITLQISGDVYTQDSDQFVSKVVKALKGAVNADEIIIRQGSRQAVELAR